MCPLVMIQGTCCSYVSTGPSLREKDLIQVQEKRT